MQRTEQAPEEQRTRESDAYESDDDLEQRPLLNTTGYETEAAIAAALQEEVDTEHSSIPLRLAYYGTA